MNRTVKWLALWWLATGLPLGGLTCLQTGCTGSVGIGPARFNVSSLDYRDIDTNARTGEPIQRPLWHFGASTTAIETSWSWDGVGIAEKAIEDTGTILRAFVGLFTGWLP